MQSSLLKGSIALNSCVVLLKDAFVAPVRSGLTLNTITYRYVCVILMDHMPLVRRNRNKALYLVILAYYNDDLCEPHVPERTATSDSISITAAAPIPVPTHMDAQPYSDSFFIVAFVPSFRS